MTDRAPDDVPTLAIKVVRAAHRGIAGSQYRGADDAVRGQLVALDVELDLTKRLEAVPRTRRSDMLLVMLRAASSGARIDAIGMLDASKDPAPMMTLVFGDDGDRRSLDALARLLAKELGRNEIR